MAETKSDRETASNDERAWRPTFKQSCWAALGIGLLIFIRVWSGYNSREPDLFSPRPLREVWGLLPASVAFSFVVLQMARLLDWAKGRPGLTGSHTLSR